MMTDYLPLLRFKLLYSDDGDEDRVVGIATRDMGIAKDQTLRVSQCKTQTAKTRNPPPPEHSFTLPAYLPTRSGASKQVYSAWRGGKRLFKRRNYEQVRNTTTYILCVMETKRHFTYYDYF